MLITDRRVDALPSGALPARVRVADSMNLMVNPWHKRVAVRARRSTGRSPDYDGFPRGRRDVSDIRAGAGYPRKPRTSSWSEPKCVDSSQSQRNRALNRPLDWILNTFSTVNPSRPRPGPAQSPRTDPGDWPAKQR